MKKFIGQLRRSLVGLFNANFESVATIPKSLKQELVAISHEKREIFAYKLGSGQLPIALVATIHGNEVGTTKLAHQLIAWLDLHKAFTNLTIYIVPCLNPDGYHLAQIKPDYWSGGRIGRFNAKGVDLNRNFPTSSFQSHTTWGFGKNYTESQEVFAGDNPGSEPEIAGLLTFLKKYNIKTYFAFHSAGHDIMPNNIFQAKKLANLFAQRTGFRYLEPEEDYDIRHTGTAKEWCEQQKISYIEIEASNRWGSDWSNQKNGLLACLEYLNKNA